MTHTASRASLATLVALSLGVTGPAGAQQIEISGQLDLVAMARRDTLNINTALRGDSPFNPVRLKLFARSWITERIGVFTELLLDIDADPRLNGAYVVVNEIGDLSWLNARLGLAPSVVGAFGLRSTYFNVNPLIGIPLVWQYRTNLSNSGTSTVASLVASDGEPGGGSPMLYDSCWMIQWEMLGEVGALEYSVALTPGALSNPIRARRVEGSMLLARVGYTPLPGLRLGLSAADGPWLSAPVLDGSGSPPYPEDPSSFDQSLLGLDLEYGVGPWLIQGELHGFRWETPLIAEELEAVGGFLEARLDFSPGWHVAGRLGGLWFGDVVTDATTGARSPWDQDTARTELAVGYRLTRQALLKVDWQRTTAGATDFEQNLLSAQLSTAF
jgi:hypothetical protein